MRGASLRRLRAGVIGPRTGASQAPERLSALRSLSWREGNSKPRRPFRLARMITLVWTSLMTPRVQGLSQQPLELRTQRRCEVVPVQSIGHIGREESDLRPAVVTLARELQSVEGLCLRQPDHRVGELDLVAGAARLRREDVEDLRLQDVASGDDEV